MEELYTTKIIVSGTSKAIIIPVNVLAGLGWQRGDRVVFTFAGDDQLIVKKLDNATVRQIKSTGYLGDEQTIQI